MASDMKTGNARLISRGCQLNTGPVPDVEGLTSGRQAHDDTICDSVVSKGGQTQKWCTVGKVVTGVVDARKASVHKSTLHCLK